MSRSTVLLCLVLQAGLLAAQQQPPAVAPTAPTAPPTRSEQTAPVAPAAEQPLPAIPDLMRQVEQHARDSEKLLKSYVFRSTQIVETLDGGGNVKKSESEVQEHSFVEGVPVVRVLMKNGKELTPAEQEKQEEKIRKEVQKEKERREENKPDPNQVTLSRILELGTFSNERRTTINGRSTILLDYAGDPEAHPHSTAETIFKLLRGTIAVDEETRSVVRAEGEFQNSLKVGGGLVASIGKGTHFNFEQTRVNGEIWLPRQIFGQGSLRVLLLVHFNGRMTATFSDYKKYRATSTLLPDLKEADEGAAPNQQQPSQQQPSPQQAPSPR